jgi:hypothetical protein
VASPEASSSSIGIAETSDESRMDQFLANGLAGWTGQKRPETSLRVELWLRGAQLDAYQALFGG